MPIPPWGKNDGVVETQEVEAPLSKKEKIKLHFKKYWWIHLIVFIATNIIGVVVAYANVPLRFL